MVCSENNLFIFKEPRGLCRVEDLRAAQVLLRRQCNPPGDCSHALMQKRRGERMLERSGWMGKASPLFHFVGTEGTTTKKSLLRKK